MKANEILLKARYDLSDVLKERWTDERLISILNDGISDLALDTRLFVQQGYLPIYAGVYEYDLSAFNVIDVQRVEFQKRKISLVSYEELEDYGGDSRDYTQTTRLSYNYGGSRYYFNSYWKDEEGDVPKAFLHNNNRLGVYRVYPIPTVSSTIAKPTLTQSYGIITDIEFINIVNELPGAELEEADKDTMILLYYRYLPEKVLTIEDELDSAINRVVHDCLAKFIVSEAYKDNKTEQNIALSQVALREYNKKKNSLDTARSMNGARKDRQTAYHTMG